MPRTFLLLFSQTFVLDYSPLNSATLSFSSEVTLHRYAGSAPKQVNYSPWTEVALRENLIIVWPNGMNDTKSGSGSGSWNVSSTFGSKGPICDLNRGNWPPPNECFESCPLCDESYSCDWTTCYDDIGFLEVVIETVRGGFQMEFVSIIRVN